MAKKGTSANIAKTASTVLNNPKSSTTAKTLAASALTQSKNLSEKTSAKVANIASRVLKDGRYSKDTKKLAGSVLGQKE